MTGGTVASDYKLQNGSVAARKEYGEAFREELLAALPATVPQLVAKFGRSRAAILHHIGLMPEKAFIDTRTYPRMIRRKE